MAIIPLKQSVLITRPGIDTGWGHATPGAETTLKARVTEETRIVKNQFGKEVVSSMSVIFDKLPQISYEDTLTFTNEIGVTISRKPLSIEPRRGIGGKPLLTEVYV
ncbi:hypothetical protein [Cohnella silvisoli]|uniref:Uncharacterized protein n=1 Tax=Cohnella silvisoli TaxID=2873699 RepID=A0ABV1L0B0_9BACL|nr:hypothetical protein [Cohnella silvisoli]MCD9024318.1 hypothetical protein [Cohnella silvisoli]